MLAADSAIDTTSRRHENQILTQCDQSLKERVNDLIDSVNELVNCSQNPGYQPQPFSHSRSPGYKKSNKWENSWSNSNFSTPQKTSPKQPRFQSRFPRVWSEPRPRFANAQSFSDRPRQSFSRPPTPFRPRNETPQLCFMGSLNTHKNDGNKPEYLDKGLYFVKDPETHLKFLIDTGNKRSFLPCWRSDGHPTTTGYLKAANGSHVPVYECVDLELSLNMNRIFAWKFCKARVQFPILGMDFLKHYGVIINTSNGTLNCVAEMTHSGSNNGADAPAMENNTNEFLPWKTTPNSYIVIIVVLCIRYCCGGQEKKKE